MKIYQVTYGGMWLGGVAIVMAPNEEKAEHETRVDFSTQNFDDVCVTELEDLGPQKHLRTKVLYNDCGDY